MDRGGAVIAFWHGEQLPLVPLHANSRIAGLASLSADGALLAGVIDRLGYSVVRGSSSRGGRGLRGLHGGARREDVARAGCDGPRGPRHRVHTGAVRLSSHRRPDRDHGKPRPPGLARSWDGFQIPLPVHASMSATERSPRVPLRVRRWMRAAASFEMSCSSSGRSSGRALPSLWSVELSHDDLRVVVANARACVRLAFLGAGSENSPLKRSTTFFARRMNLSLSPMLSLISPVRSWFKALRVYERSRKTLNLW